MRRSIIMAAAAAAIALTALPAGAQDTAGDWVEVFQDDSIGRVYLDRNSPRRDGGHVTLRSMARLSRPLEDGTATMVGQFRYNCAARTVELLNFTMLNADDGVIVSHDVPADMREVEQIAPDSPNEALLGVVCA